MKEELIKFIMERADKQYWDDFPISSIPVWINEFFDQYNKGRHLKNEDPYHWTNVVGIDQKTLGGKE